MPKEIATVAVQKPAVVAEQGAIVRHEPTFSELQQMAVAISKSGLFAVKTPEAALTLLLIAQAEGIPPAQAMMDYDVIHNRPALKSAAMLARFQRSGGKVQWLQGTDDVVEGRFSHPVGGEITVKWDTARCIKAGLAKVDNHVKFPTQMKRARCISEAVRAINPQCIPSGMYTVEEAIDIPETLQTVPVETAVADAVNAVTNVMDPAEVDDLVTSMDVKTLADLKTKFAAAWKRGDEVGDRAAMERFKRVYDQQKADLEAGAIE